MLEKWGQRCAYCGAENILLEIEHIVPRQRSGVEPSLPVEAGSSG